MLSGIQHQDLNSQPSNWESPPLTTRPGLPHIAAIVEQDTFIELKYYEDGGSKKFVKFSFQSTKHSKVRRRRKRGIFYLKLSRQLFVPSQLVGR